MADDRAGPLPGVSYVMPVLNEEGYIAAAVASVLAQEYPAPAEVVLALGPSTDRTNEIVAALAEKDERIRTVDNPRADIASGMNLAIRAARHPVIVRVDAHVQLPPGYTARAVKTLQRTGAANVGGIMAARGRPGFQAAVARAYNSPLGLGGAPYHSSDGTPGPAESAYLGVMRADTVTQVGGFDETLRRGEDWELNHRLAAAGHVVWLDPRLRVTYWPRSTWPDLAKQFWATGVWRGELVRRLGPRNSVRFFAPPGLVLTALAAIGPLKRARRPARLMLAVYAATLGTAAARADGSLRDKAEYALVLATMHVAWGSGFLVGVTRGGGETIDTSRAGQISQDDS